ncbi:hypothetical protein XA68_15632 [Ophiocordyceps unilateralis]|uniref:DUF8035 domain-containing protein n=1 Tax=Ophiocordyceps unilateralis TaxID=268505 RepID=A0A2A9PM67_OPHUN|nr:hypothetical protein XA68_15632 [Ophiocordyceps unilateralis]
MPSIPRDKTRSIKSVQASAASLRDRVQTAGSGFTAATKALEELHDAMTRLRSSVRDPDALPCGSAACLLLTSIVMNCHISLNQLADLLNKHEAASSRIDTREDSVIAFLLTKLVRQRADIDTFLEAAHKYDIYSEENYNSDVRSETARPRAAVLTSPSCIEPELWDYFLKEIRGEVAVCSPDNHQGHRKKRAKSPLNHEPEEWQYISTSYLLFCDQQSQMNDSRCNSSTLSLHVLLGALHSWFVSAWLEPDSSGNEIGPNATWTRIDRRLVSAQVLGQAGMRYEARHDSVSVLGALSSAQIRDLMNRSAQVRRQRSPFSNPSPFKSPQPWPQPQERARGAASRDADTGEDGGYAFRDNKSETVGVAMETAKGETPARLRLEEMEKDTQRKRDRRRRGDERRRRRSRSCHSNRPVRKEGIRIRDVLGVVGSIASVVSLAKEFAKI